MYMLLTDKMIRNYNLSLLGENGEVIPRVSSVDTVTKEVTFFATYQLTTKSELPRIEITNEKSPITIQKIIPSVKVYPIRRCYFKGSKVITDLDMEREIITEQDMESGTYVNKQ